MLKPNQNKFPKMTPEERENYQRAVAEENAAKDENIAAAKLLVPLVKERCKDAVEIIAKLRQAREAKGISLSDLEARTGILKSALSRLENSQAPNPTLGYLQRYAEAIGYRLVICLDTMGEL